LKRKEKKEKGKEYHGEVVEVHLGDGRVLGEGVDQLEQALDHVLVLLGQRLVQALPLLRRIGVQRVVAAEEERRVRSSPATRRANTTAGGGSGTSSNRG
jgi:hypothetical protein